ncbi:MAG: DUF58 domain-containing protein [Mariprofundus sp.]
MKHPDIYVSLKELMLLQHQASGFSFLPRQPVHSVLSGRHASRLRGRGLDFDEMRHYRIGDDIRNLDWKVTNRTGKPHVRVFREERDRPVFLLVDQRINMFFGSQIRMKSVVAAQLAALAAWRVLSAGDRVGAVIFTDNNIIEAKPRRSRKTTMQILHHIVSCNHALSADYAGKQNDAQLNRALKQTERISGHDGLIVIISDMSGWDQETVKRIKRLARHNDVVASLVFDPLEQSLPDHSQLVLSDGHLQLQVDTGKTGLGKDYSEHFDNRVDSLQQTLHRHGVPVIPLHTCAPVQEQIKQVIGKKRNATP